MKKKCSLLLSLVAILMSCNNIQEDKKDLYDDDNLYTLFNIYNTVLERMKNADSDELELAFINQDNEKINNLLNYSDSEISETLNDMDIAVNNLINQYPEINKMLNELKKNDCKKCNTDIVEAFQILKKNNFQNIVFSNSVITKNDAEEGCNNSDGLIACIIACAVAPVTVWAYPACCTFCYYTFC